MMMREEIKISKENIDKMQKMKKEIKISREDIVNLQKDDSIKQQDKKHDDKADAYLYALWAKRNRTNCFVS